MSLKEKIDSFICSIKFDESKNGSQKSKSFPQDELDANCAGELSFQLPKKTSLVLSSGGVFHSSEIKRFGLIEDLCEDCLKESSYDLRLGEAHYVFCKDAEGKAESWMPCYIGKNLGKFNKRSSDGKVFKIQDDTNSKRLLIPPYGSAFIQLHEIVNTLDVAEKCDELVVGRFDLRLSMVHKGLISQQATQVEPLYKGRLFCFIHNLSNKEVGINYLERFATIEFQRVSFSDGAAKKKILDKIKKSNVQSKYKGKQHCLNNGIEDIRYFSTSIPLPQDCGLLAMKSEVDRNIEKIGEKLANDASFVGKVESYVEKRLTRRDKIIAAAISAIATLIIAFATTFISNSGLRTQIEEQAQELKHLYEQIEEQAQEIKYLHEQVEYQAEYGNRNAGMDGNP